MTSCRHSKIKCSMLQTEQIFVKDIHNNNHLSLHGVSWVLRNLEMNIQYCKNKIKTHSTWMQISVNIMKCQRSNTLFIWKPMEIPCNEYWLLLLISFTNMCSVWLDPVTACRALSSSFSSIYIYIYIYIYTHMYMYMHMYAYVYVCVCVCMYTYMYVYVYVSIRICICMYTYAL